jgi:hypothetical protein
MDSLGRSNSVAISSLRSGKRLDTPNTPRMSVADDQASDEVHAEPGENCCTSFLSTVVKVPKKVGGDEES